ncbi:MAG: carbamoyltransferase HypF, partial [Gemmatimonadetes bacterium]|nr:carbamoyltransferase HypF [Gemmatimonadota bacterium]NIQ54078.1 carbamoyltransferase HypF [Gemmatimonadota bacterium]NIU74271.1 carbamoyltransferase HypF [Gammaproteobacteria bacterium]NIX44288.1 carbamoyltransferase HypF [Gemmatimonadota bacterium]NIY08505.1 carbamoyltransferase HypF [Gemmatimonadota bacterium]
VRAEPPPRAVIKELREEWLPPAGLQGLTILPSEAIGERAAAVLPDLATCEACLADIGLAPGTGRPDRRRGYAFTNCTDCGPRFSIIRALPYDRPNTTMAAFALCPECRSEYEDPRDRRFHAQPTACPACGPRLRIVDASGAGGGRDTGVDGVADSGVVVAAARALAEGRIVALKGLGGFHLLVDAADGPAVRRLRERKRRPVKPLAVMVRDLPMARTLCGLSAKAEALLLQPEAPIVLLPRREDAPISDAVAPGNPCLGIMLPYTPLHHLLMKEVDRPVVATSGNLSDEPICIDEDEARRRLGAIADVFVVHDRPIERPVDDSVLRIVRGAPQPVRRSRGYAPLPVTLTRELPSILAVGGHLKNTVALSRGSDVFLSQHIGDLETPQALDAFERVIADFLRLYEVEPALVAHDLHPDYGSTGWAVQAVDGAGNGAETPALAGARRVPVQHHHAHLAACLADTRADRALG